MAAQELSQRLDRDVFSMRSWSAQRQDSRPVEVAAECATWLMLQSEHDSTAVLAIDVDSSGCAWRRDSSWSSARGRLVAAVGGRSEVISVRLMRCLLLFIAAALTCVLCRATLFALA